MAVTSGQAAALRALLSGAARESASLTATLPSADTRSFGLLLQAALVLTARRHFAPAYESGDIVRYVARLRTVLASQPGGLNLDPHAAEAVLYRALGKSAESGADAQTNLRVVPALLALLASDLTLNGSGLDEVVDDAEALACQWQAGLQQPF